MAWIIVLSIIALPLLEVAIFVKVSQAVGILPALLGAVVAGIAGLALWRHQGLQTLLRARQVMDEGRMPVAQLFDGLCLALAGGLLLLPGYLSDVLALLLILPPTRALIGAVLARRFVVTDGAAGPQAPGARPQVIDVEFEEVRRDGDQPPPPRLP